MSIYSMETLGLAEQPNEDMSYLVRVWDGEHTLGPGHIPQPDRAVSTGTG